MFCPARSLFRLRRLVSTLSGQRQLRQEHSAELEISSGALSGESATPREGLRKLTDTYNVLWGSDDCSSRAVDRQIRTRDREVTVWHATGIVAMVVAAAGWIVVMARYLTLEVRQKPWGRS